MSVGAGSIKRAARTAKTGNKAAVITGAEAEVMEALTGSREQGTEVTADSKENAAEVADEEGKVGEVVPEDTETHEAYEIGQELPVYLL